MNHNTIGIYHIHVSCFIPAKKSVLDTIRGPGEVRSKANVRPTTLVHIKVESFQALETQGKWMLAKWVEKVELAFGGKL